METRILLADRQYMFREAVRDLLEREPGFHVVADTDDGEQLLQLIEEHNPDILLIDTRLRKRSGIEALHEISAAHKTVRPIVFTDDYAQDQVIQAMLWGARGFLRKNSITQLLFKSIRSVMAGQYWISHGDVIELVQSMRSLSAMVEKSAQLQTHSLSQQQQQIVEAIVAGCTNREIAEDLDLSERTVKYHLTKIFGKLGVSGRMELARFSLKKRLAPEG
jgi:two-component system, NarL family, nitrate/nitrite response regulator NarL